MGRLFLILLLVLSPPSRAVQLFGVDLATARRDALRQAVKQAGAELITEAGEDGFFDAYRSDKLLTDSRRLYLGFVKDDGAFAFAEYEFPGLEQPRMLRKLSQRYGPPSETRGRFLSDRIYRWYQGPILIELRQDWPLHAMRLSYRREAGLRRLRAERNEWLRQRQQQQDKDLKQAW